MVKLKLREVQREGGGRSLCDKTHRGLDRPFHIQETAKGSVL